MTPQEIGQIITIARRAPLRDMNEAEAVAALLQKLAQHFAPKVGDVHTPGQGTQNRSTVEGTVDADKTAGSD